MFNFREAIEWSKNHHCQRPHLCIIRTKDNKNNGHHGKKLWCITLIWWLMTKTTTYLKRTMAQGIQKKKKILDIIMIYSLPKQRNWVSNKHPESVHSSLLKVKTNALPQKDGAVSKTDTMNPETAQAGPVLSNQVEVLNKISQI